MIRVRVRDLNTTNLSYWSTAETLIVLAPAEQVNTLVCELGFGSLIGSPSPQDKDISEYDSLTLNWNGRSGKEYAILFMGTMNDGWQVHPDAQLIEGYDGPMSVSIQVEKTANSMFFRIRERDLTP